ncbi:MAG: dockerin type I repeat-containing protein [Planctomycetota bacterium]
MKITCWVVGVCLVFATSAWSQPSSPLAPPVTLQVAPDLSEIVTKWPTAPFVELRRTGATRALSAQPFGPCAVDCSGAIAEIELCGDSSNDGCSVECGPDGTETVGVISSLCGTLFAENGTRDVDYYELTITEVTSLSITIRSEMPVSLSLAVDQAADCSTLATLRTELAAADCLPTELTWIVLPGTYYAIVTTADGVGPIFSGYPCAAAYTYHLDFFGAGVDCLPPCTGTTENEPCLTGSTGTNGGCNLLTPAFEPYTLGQLVCGTASTFAFFRDTDWYEFSVNSPTGLAQLDIVVASEFPSIHFLLPTGCPTVNSFMPENDRSVGCNPAASTLVVPNGTYYFFISTNTPSPALFPLDCTDPANQYQFRIDSSPATSSCTLTCSGDIEPGSCGVESSASCATATPMTLGVPMCGRAFADAGTRDVDYWTFHVPALADITIELTSTLPQWLLLGDDNCASGQSLITNEFLLSSDCVPDALTITLAPGNYVMVSTPGTDPFQMSPAGQIFSGFPCGFDNDFSLLVTSAPVSSTPCPVVCPVSATNETEACGSDASDWCSSTIGSSLPEPLTLGIPACGQLYANGTRDQDYYSFALAQPTDVELALIANLPTRAVIRSIANFPACPASMLDVPGSELFADQNCNATVTGALTLAAGDYVVYLTTEDPLTGPTFGGYPCMTANDYLLTLTPVIASCPPLMGSCSHECATGDLTFEFTSVVNLLSASYEVLDGDNVVVASGSIAGPISASSATSVVVSGLASGAYRVEVTAFCSSGVTATTPLCTVGLFPWTQPDSVVVSLESAATGGRGCVDSTAALQAALVNAGESVLVLPGTVSLDEQACVTDGLLNDPDTVLWIVGGTFPHNRALSLAEGTLLADLVQAGTSIYNEGGDFWGFDPPTSFYDFDGVQGNLALAQASGLPAAVDGDDSLTFLTGGSTPLVDLSVFNTDSATHPAQPQTVPGVRYAQDRTNPAPMFGNGNDSTDRLVPAAFTGNPMIDDQIPDASGHTLWTNADDGVPDPTAPEGAYVTGILYYSDSPAWIGGRVISQSFEFGGLPAIHRDAIALAYLRTLRGDELFRRGDCNGDGGTDIADAVRLLNVLFPQSCTPGIDCPQFACADACDANDDGNTDIADAVFVLNILFPQSCTPGVNCPIFPSPGNASCGSDPTIDSLPACLLGCP